MTPTAHSRIAPSDIASTMQPLHDIAAKIQAGWKPTAAEAQSMLAAIQMLCGAMKLIGLDPHKDNRHESLEEIAERIHAKAMQSVSAPVALSSVQSIAAGVSNHPAVRQLAANIADLQKRVAAAQAEHEAAMWKRTPTRAEKNEALIAMGLPPIP